MTVSERSGVGTVELAILEEISALGALPDRGYIKSVRVNTAVQARIGLAPRYSYRILVDLAQPWQLQLPLVDGRGNFGGRGDDPPAYAPYTECRLSAVGQVVLAAERGELAPVPVGLINGNTNNQGGSPPFRPQGVIDAIRLAAGNPHATDDELLDVLGPPDFITGCSVTGDLAALRAGRPAEIRLEARIRIATGAAFAAEYPGAEVSRRPADSTLLLVDKFPPYANIDETVRTIAERAHRRHERAYPELDAASRLPLNSVNDRSSSRNGCLVVCVLEPDADPERARERLRTVYGVSVTLPVRLPGPLASMIRQWVAAHRGEDVMASLAALAEAVAAQGSYSGG